jgi:hypothetical protein
MRTLFFLWTVVVPSILGLWPAGTQSARMIGGEVLEPSEVVRQEPAKQCILPPPPPPPWSTEPEPDAEKHCG